MMRTRAAACFLILASLSASAAPRTIDTALGQADVAILGADPKDENGAAVLLADLDGDGFDDLIFGASHADSIGEARSKAGEVYVVYGSRGLPATLDLKSTRPDVILYGGLAGDQFGSSVAVGDINGDGYRDLVVGATYGVGPLKDRIQPGQVYVFFGGPRRLPVQWDLAAVPADVTIYGVGVASKFGNSLLVARLDSDSIGDLVIGAPNDNSNGRGGGKVYVFNGRRSWPAVIDLLRSSADRTFFGAASNDELGRALAAADEDGDGIGDLALSAPLTRRPSRAHAGSVHVYYSSHARGPIVDLRTDTGDWEILGSDALGWFGWSVSMGDFDGDGTPDVAAGAPQSWADVNRPFAGKVYVIRGDRTLGRRTDLSVSSPDMLVLGARDRGRLGSSLAAVDFDGDGIDDLVMGAPVETPDISREYAGIARVLLGSRALPPLVDLAIDPVEVKILGPSYVAALGETVAVGDVDRDGGIDLLLGAPFGPPSSDPRPFAGEVYLVRGEPRPCAIGRGGSGARVAGSLRMRANAAHDPAQPRSPRAPVSPCSASSASASASSVFSSPHHSWGGAE